MELRLFITTSHRHFAIKATNAAGNGSVAVLQLDSQQGVAQDA